MKFVNNQTHPFHLVDPIPWPLTAAIGGLFSFTATASYVGAVANSIKELIEFIIGSSSGRGR